MLVNIAFGLFSHCPQNKLWHFTSPVCGPVSPRQEDKLVGEVKRLLSLVTPGCLKF